MDRPPYIFAKRDTPALLDAQHRKLRDEINELPANRLMAAAFDATKSIFCDDFAIAPSKSTGPKRTLRRKK